MECVVTSKLLRLACAWLCLQACLGHAQDAEGLSRARRDADSPLRLIIEASKLKPRQKSGEAAPAASARADKLAAHAASGKGAGTASAPPADESGAAARTMELADVPSNEPLAPAPMLEPTLLPALAELQLEAAADVPPPLPAIAETPLALQAAAPIQGLLQTQVLGPVASAPVSAGEVRRELDTAVAEASVPVLKALPASASAVALQIEDYFEPQLPERVRRRLHSDAEVVVNFTVNADGSVSDASVQSSSEKSLDPIALDAVRQWRYRPIAAAQTHAVQLVFRLRD